MAAHTVFISDLHLTRERPEAVERFRRFLGEVAMRAGTLYILGDFFEAWVGDDDLSDPFNAGIAADLRHLAGTGTSIGLLHGNRDFVLGPEFAEAAGLSLLPDPSVIDLYGTPSLISHGDAWCTDDQTYQAFRAQVRNPAWQAAALARPLAERHALARAMREQSEKIKPGVKPEIMDVNAGAIAEAFRAHAVRRIIHGHTHRPARHESVVDGRACERWVLPDWYDSGGYLLCTAAGCELLWLD
jgi:UDP-2,3-diacylglucosamine hydrolase